MIQKASTKNRRRPVIIAVALVFSHWLSIAHAQSPGSYRVINVKPGSALNVRADHNSSSEDIGSASLGSELKVVEFSPNGGWAKVHWDGDFGWVSMRFLSPEGSSDADVAKLAYLQRTQGQTPFTEQQLAAASTAVPAEVEANAVTTTIASAADLAEIDALNIPTTAALLDTPSQNNPSISCSGNGQSWTLTLDKTGSLVFQAPDNNALFATTQWRQAINNKDTYAFAVADIKGTLLRQQCLSQSKQQNQPWQLELQTNGFGGYAQLSGCCSSQ